MGIYDTHTQVIGRTYNSFMCNLLVCSSRVPPQKCKADAKSRIFQTQAAPPCNNLEDIVLIQRYQTKLILEKIIKNSTPIFTKLFSLPEDYFKMPDFFGLEHR